MTKSQLEYFGPLVKPDANKPSRNSVWKRIPVGFSAVVAVPSVIAAIYYGVIAAPIYVSEAQFIVRTPGQHQPTGLGMALQGVGLPLSVSDTFAVHEYMTSRDGLRDVQSDINVRNIIGNERGDFLTRYPALGEDLSNEGLYKAFNRFITVGYASSTGISTLRVKGFTPEDAEALADALLSKGEQLVNRLNERAAEDMLASAQSSETEARNAVEDVTDRLTKFRNDAGYVDPDMMARESVAITSELQIALANLRVEREQLVAGAPQSPLIADLDRRVVALERQLEQQRSKMVGHTKSLASSAGQYQRLLVEQEIADKRLAQATASLVSAREDARRQNIYLDRIVNPTAADKPIQPRRLRGFLTVFFTSLLIYGLGWLVYAGIREHRQN